MKRPSRQQPIRSEFAQGLVRCIHALAAEQQDGCYRMLFAHFYPRLVTFFVKRGMTPLRAEDSAQEVMLVVWHDAALFDAQQQSVSGWVFEIALDLATSESASRQQWDDLIIPLPEVPLHAEQMEDGVADADETLKLYAALKVLTAGDADLLHSAYIDELSHSDLAKRLQSPIGSIKSRIRKSIIKLREVMRMGRP
jgi:RNA polymerase sigma-70 factor (ECF subfamily)